MIYFPCEILIAVVEVKRFMDKQEAGKALKGITSVKQLRTELVELLPKFPTHTI